MLLRLETAIHADDKRIIGETQYIPFGENLLDLVPQHKVIFINLLHRETLPTLFVFNQINSTIGAVRYMLDDVEILLVRICGTPLLAIRRRRTRSKAN